MATSPSTPIPDNLAVCHFNDHLFSFTYWSVFAKKSRYEYFYLIFYLTPHVILNRNLCCFQIPRKCTSKYILLVILTLTTIRDNIPITQFELRGAFPLTHDKIRPAFVTVLMEWISWPLVSAFNYRKVFPCNVI